MQAKGIEVLHLLEAFTDSFLCAEKLHSIAIQIRHI